AFMITIQIRADDHREERKQQNETVSVAQTLKIEVNWILDAYVERSIRSERIKELIGDTDYELMKVGWITPSFPQGGKIWNEVKYGNSVKLSRDRIDRFNDLIGKIGHEAASDFIRFYEQFPNREEYAKFELNSILTYIENDGYFGRVGERLILSLNDVIQANGNLSLIKENPIYKSTYSASLYARRLDDMRNILKQIDGLSEDE
ncbi:hypothetical protein, partial [Trichormus sp. NMC-1]|uniref:hypothetical protein n=1 Tax=Trichormus sp. NMC-1 TaxID=1853259 RepID=UPI001F195DC1